MLLSFACFANTRWRLLFCQKYKEKQIYWLTYLIYNFDKEYQSEQRHNHHSNHLHIKYNLNLILGLWYWLLQEKEYHLNWVLVQLLNFVNWRNNDYHQIHDNLEIEFWWQMDMEIFQVWLICHYKLYIKHCIYERDHQYFSYPSQQQYYQNDTNILRSCDNIFAIA